MIHVSSTLLCLLYVAILPRYLQVEAWLLPTKASCPRTMLGTQFSSSMSVSHSSLLADGDVVDTTRPRKLVIVGSGIGGLSSAFDARHMLHPKDEITVVSARDTFQFTPSNPWVATRYRKPEDITLQIEPILSKHNIKFVHSEVTKLDPERQELKLKDGKEPILLYDFLIIATGPRLDFEDIPGTGPNGHAHSVCTTPHASEAAEAVDRLVVDPGPVVIGAVQSASCFGPAYEFALLLNHELVKRGGKQLAEKCPTTFVTSEPYVGHLGLQGAGKSNQILEHLLVRKKMDWITNCSVKYVTKDSVAVEYLEDTEGDDKFIKRTKTIPSKFTMLIPAFKNMKVWTSVPGLTDNKSEMILTNKFQQSVAYPNVFGVGICAHLDTLEATPIPTGAPKTGYMIESMGTAAVKNIKGMIDFEKKQGQDEEIEQKDIVLHNVPLLNGLCITDFGNEGAIFLTLPQQPPRRTDITVDGKVATLAKIAFEKYFIHKIETGDTDPYYEKYMLHLIGVDRAIET